MSTVSPDSKRDKIRQVETPSHAMQSDSFQSPLPVDPLCPLLGKGEGGREGDRKEKL